MNKLLKEAEKYTLYITIFLLPLAFSPMFFNAFITIKLAILVLGVSLVIILRILRIVSTGSFDFQIGSFDFPVFFLVLAYALSGWYMTPNKIDAFFFPGIATIVIASAVLYFLVNQLTPKDKDKLIYIVLSSVFISSLIYLLAFVGLFQNLDSLPQFMRNRAFTTQGALLSAGIMMSVTIVYSIGIIKETKDYLYKILIGCAVAIISISLFIVTFSILTDKQNAKIAGFAVSTSVAFDSLKNSALLGVGPSNYVAAYTRFRPLEVNRTDDWTLRYSQGRNMFLTTVTETGFAGAFALIILLIIILKIVNTEIAHRERNSIALIDHKIAGVFVLLILLALFPATGPEIYALFFIGLSVASKTKSFHIGPWDTENKGSKVPSVIVVTPVILLIGYFLITGSKLLAAERTYKVALDQLSRNEASQTYQTLQRAINQSPRVDRYHSTYSRINFLLAELIAKKESLTDSDRETITKLIEQSIREAKTAVALNRTKAGNWEMLGSTYRNVMSLSKDAAGYAIQAYSQAIILDPINPDLRLDLGRIWYAVKNYENAVDTFKLAVIAKPDHANARYNLAAAYREKGDVDRAIAELKVVLTLVKADSKDYEKAKAELDELENKKKSATAKEDGESLTTPETNKPIINPQLDLPESASPEDLSTPSPSVSPTPTAQP